MTFFGEHRRYTLKRNLVRKVGRCAGFVNAKKGALIITQIPQRGQVWRLLGKATELVAVPEN